MQSQVPLLHPNILQHQQDNTVVFCSQKAQPSSQDHRPSMFNQTVSLSTGTETEEHKVMFICDLHLPGQGDGSQLGSMHLSMNSNTTANSNNCG